MKNQYFTELHGIASSGVPNVFSPGFPRARFCCVLLMRDFSLFMSLIMSCKSDSRHVLSPRKITWAAPVGTNSTAQSNIDVLVT